ncbi:MAG: hypothetical protein AAGF31_00965 [Planctomycetota bacterium]
MVSRSNEGLYAANADNCQTGLEDRAPTLLTTAADTLRSTFAE